jgi:membrane-bound acyltransferase YfiQ involved in biofilm formation
LNTGVVLGFEYWVIRRFQYLSDRSVHSGMDSDYWSERVLRITLSVALMGYWWVISSSLSKLIQSYTTNRTLSRTVVGDLVL